MAGKTINIELRNKGHNELKNDFYNWIHIEDMKFAININDQNHDNEITRDNSYIRLSVNINILMCFVCNLHIFCL